MFAIFPPYGIVIAFLVRLLHVQYYPRRNRIAIAIAIAIATTSAAAAAAAAAATAPSSKKRIR